MTTQDIKRELENGIYDDLLRDIYVEEGLIAYQKERYAKAISSYEAQFGEEDVVLFSAPGRSEIGGNHTDHQRGEILAAAINLDAIAVVKKTEDAVVKVVSDGYDMITIDLATLEKRDEEKETTTALIKGVLAGMENRGYDLGGFNAYVTSDVLIGAGLSSSAAFETLIGTIISGLYNAGKVSAIEIAEIGQYAENEYFGKPCGLMDQMACSVGSLVHVDFGERDLPKVEQVEFDLSAHGYSLCITDTKGSHADLTQEYAAVPSEMKQVASHFGKEVLIEISMQEVLEQMTSLRQKYGDRAVLRAMHFFEENHRVQKEVQSLREDDIDAFLSLVKASGASSFQYLQNVYTNQDVRHQNVSMALAVSDMYLGSEGVSRVHGGGFAGTIQAFVRNDMVTGYQKQMEHVFGTGACRVLQIRKYGGLKVMG